MLGKFFIIVTMVTSTPQLGTDLFAFEHAYESEKACLEKLQSDPTKYFTAAYLNFKGKLRPDKGYCVSGELLKEVLEGNIKNSNI